MVVQHNIKNALNNNLILRHVLAFILYAMRIRLDEGLFDKKQSQPVSLATLSIL